MHLLWLLCVLMMTAVIQHPQVRCLQPKSAQSALGKGPLYAGRMSYVDRKFTSGLSQICLLSEQEAGRQGGGREHRLP